MRPLFIIFAILVLLSGCSSRKEERLQLGKVINDTRIIRLNGDYEPLLDAQEGKQIVLFWAAWCSRSRSVIAELAEWQRSDPNALPITAISIDKSEDEEKLLQRIEDQDLRGLRHAFSGNGGSDEAAQRFSVDELPTLFLIDDEGKVQAVGSDLDEIRGSL